jgi:hypothetical protein
MSAGWMWGLRAVACASGTAAGATARRVDGGSGVGGGEGGNRLSACASSPCWGGDGSTKAPAPAFAARHHYHHPFTALSLWLLFGEDELHDFETPRPHDARGPRRGRPPRAQGPL